MKTALFVLVAGVEELEAVAPIDILRRAGVEVTVAGLHEGSTVVGRCGVVIGVEVTLGAVDKRLFDAIVVPGGPGVALLRKDARVGAALKHHYEAGRIVAAICAAPVLLAQAGLLEGRRHTAHPTVADELPHLLANERVVEDGTIITSRGAGTAVDFGLTLAARLTTQAKADEVRAAICA